MMDKKNLVVVKIVNELMKYNTKYRNYQKFPTFFNLRKLIKLNLLNFPNVNTVNQFSHLLNSTENVTFEQKCVKENSSSFNSKSLSDSNDILAETSTVNTFIEISCSSDSSVLYEATTNDKALQIMN